MQRASFRLDHWPSVVAHVNSLVDLEASARTHKALLRKRGVRRAADLLHLALLYGPGGLSLRSVASHATQAGIADVCDVSLLDRLRNSGDFLVDVLDHLLADRRGDAPTDGRLQLNLVDGSTVSVPGSKGSDWRLHARYEPARGCFTDLAITEATTAEALVCVAVRPGDVLVQDRGYARVRNFAHARVNKANFITRIGWRSVKLFDPSSTPFDLMAVLSDSGPAVVEHAVSIGAGHDPVAARLIITRKPPEATGQQQKRLHRKASRKGQKTDPRTLKAAGFMMLLASLSPTSATADEVVRLYRMRRQIELAFKRLKSLGGFAALQAHDRALARSWLLAHLIATVIIETSLGDDLDSPPLSQRLPGRSVTPVFGVGGNLTTGACDRLCLPCQDDAGVWLRARWQADAWPSRHESGRLKQNTLKSPYPSAYGAMSPPLRLRAARPRPRARTSHQPSSPERARFDRTHQACPAGFWR